MRSSNSSLKTTSFRVPNHYCLPKGSPPSAAVAIELIQRLAHIRGEQIGRDAVVTSGKMGEVRHCQAWDESKVRDRGG